MNLKHGVFKEIIGDPWQSFHRLKAAKDNFRYTRYLGLFGYYHITQA